MKFIFVIALFAIVSCKDTKKKESPYMSGVYNMLSQTVTRDKKDTTYTTIKQLKIYTDDYMMYGNIDPADSVSSFGIGSYSADKGVVKENVIYNASDTSDNATIVSYTLLIEKTAKGYKQVIPEMESQGQKLKLTEEYDSVGSSAKSPLDGAWKLVKSYSIKGKDTSINKATQYKTYYAGHFLFGHTYTDSSHKLHTGIGFGTFEMNGTNKVKENIAVSTYYEIRGKSFDTDVEMNGADEFKQTIFERIGVKDVDVYQRLKK